MGEPALEVRAFGAVGGDLDVDFDALDGASAVTAVLERCARPGRDWWPVTIGGRIEALLAVVEASDPRDFEVVLTCSGCGEQLEVALPPRALIDYQRSAVAAPVAVRVGDRALRLRLPTGEDVRRWTVAGAPDGATIARELAVDDAPDALDSGALAAIEEALAAADPLVDFKVIARCHECGAENEAEVDLEGLACRRLRKAQALLLDDVHRLAFAYHWSEAELLAMSASRRAQYLARLDRLGA